ncbi:putative transcriptional regulator [Marivirga sericea]|uniref:Putative transcriptional regulator n=1 Tax=Marivirga sericea TaxID=1028 RepID=A0A1X7I9H0_9BACT|nr:helix-turn-helix transcriptional regulator [Marivirga sericea]SMG10595.1 putative transcriptional regulator [Marivirga sericea]
MKNRVKVLRAEHNITQADLANSVQVSRQTINAIEKEKFDPSLDLAFKLSKFFSKSIEEIFEYHNK